MKYDEFGDDLCVPLAGASHVKRIINLFSDDPYRNNFEGVDMQQLMNDLPHLVVNYIELTKRRDRRKDGPHTWL